MYSDTVTVFNRYRSRLGDMWYPTILRNVNINSDKANILSNYGEQSQDRVVLNVKYDNVDGNKVVCGKRYLLPKEWEAQTNDVLAETITFASGQGFDFFLIGEYEESVINDEDYLDGFYNYMNDKYDNVYAITSVSEFSVIPHLEITGR